MVTMDIQDTVYRLFAAAIPYLDADERLDVSGLVYESEWDIALLDLMRRVERNDIAVDPRVWDSARKHLATTRFAADASQV